MNADKRGCSKDPSNAAAGRHPGRRPRRSLAFYLCSSAFICGSVLPLVLPAATGPPASQPARITVRLVTADGRLASDMEVLQPIAKTVFDETGSKTVALGERAVLWVRNANVDGKFAFELFHKGKYINRRAELAVKVADLGVGEHVIDPGAHKFRLSADGKLSSDDPEITIDGRTVSLRVHRVEVLPVDGAKVGPPQTRLVGASLGLWASKPDTTFQPDDLDDPKVLNELKTLPTMLSHVRKFYPLHIYLPSNTVGLGYILYPSWQAFHLTPGGKVDLKASGSPPVPGIEADPRAPRRIVIPYRRFLGKLSTKLGLQSGVGNNLLRPEMLFSPTIERLRFRAVVGKPKEGDEKSFLPVDNDFSKNPNKLFLADNTTKDPHAIRLMALEWAHPVFTRGQQMEASLRLLQSPDKRTLAKPAARMSYCRYDPSSPDERKWQPLGAARWDGSKLTFTVPDVPYGFYVFRAMILDAASTDTHSPLNGEMFACVINAGQAGTAGFFTNKGRNAFVIGEDIHVHAVLRSRKPRPPAKRQILLKHPGGRQEALDLQDTGQTWLAMPLVIPGQVTRNLRPGRYELSFAGLPGNIAAWPLAFELASDQQLSLYKIIKPSKYTGPMNSLVPSHNGRTRNGEAYDLDRAVATLSEMGYSRIDLHTYDDGLLHTRPHAKREHLAATDARLMAPDVVYAPSPRNQILNACVRHRVEFSDFFLAYGDFTLPRYVQGYIEASKRWIQREMAAMRHSPAFDGMMLYDEMYDQAAVGLREETNNLWPKIRDRAAARHMGKPVNKVQSGMSRYVSRPKNQRDPKALEEYLKLQRFERFGWGDYNTQVTDAARRVAPRAKFGTYHRTWMLPGSCLGTINGWPPDVFANLDYRADTHYADNMTGWVHSSIMVPALSFAPRKPVWVNIPLLHEVYTLYNGEYQRHMAFAMLMQGADGVSMYGLPTTFNYKETNPGTVAGMESTKHLNREILAPFGELASRTEPGYRKVGIVTTLNQFLLDEYKRIATAHMAEELWVACWRLGYQAAFLRDDAFEQPLAGFQVIFVPDVRFEGELTEQVIDRLKEAIAAGTKVVVEAGSELELPGILKLDDMDLLNFYIAHYFPTWEDDELLKIFEKSQVTTDYLRKKLPELGVEPVARGPFKVGPTWRSTGSIHYLVMANFEDPDYGHVIKQVMAKPVRMPLSVPAHRGKVAYDLLRQEQLALRPKGSEVTFALDMAQIQGGLAAFLPEPVGKLAVRLATATNGRSLKIKATLVGQSGKPIPGAFPTRIVLTYDGDRQQFYRVLGGNLSFELNLPASEKPLKLRLEVREQISGQTAAAELTGPTPAGPSLRLLDMQTPAVPYPAQVKRFLAENKKAKLIVSDRLPGLEAIAEKLAAALRDRGIEVTPADEMTSYRYPSGDPEKEDALEDGFHTWYSSEAVIQPATVVDSPVILMTPKSGSYLFDGLVANGFLTIEPAGGPGLPVRPSIQVAPRGLHWKYDTLCLIANDAEGMRRAVEVLTKSLPAPRPRGKPTYANAKVLTSTKATAVTPAIDFMGNNELIRDIRFDKAGNLYVITWGHGDNLYSLDPAGKLRFSRHLPEAGARELRVFDDRVVAATAAGGRMYHLTLDGKPILQTRLTLDPGPVGDDTGYAMNRAAFAYLPDLKLALHNVGRMQMFNANGKIVRSWAGEEYRDKDVGDKTYRRQQHAYVFSPNRQRIAQIETSMYYTRWDYMDQAVFETHLVIRDLTGKLLAEHKGIATETERPTAELLWLDRAPGPALIVKGEKWQFDPDLKLLYTVPYDPGFIQLGGEKRLLQDGSLLRYVDGEKPEICRMGPFDVMPTYGRLSPDGKRLALLDEVHQLWLYDATTGKRLAGVKVPQLGRVLAFTPNSGAVLVGGLRGLIMKYDLSGKPLWQARLGDHNKSILSPKLYDPSFRDITETLWPSGRDHPGELKAMVRMGTDRLVNGNCEGKGGWAGGKVVYHPQGYRSAHSLKVSAETVSQEIARYLGEHVTWVLEFFYRSVDAAKRAELLAGVRVDSKYPDSVARTLRAGKGWQFARLVVKSGMHCTAMQVGFQASGGEVLIDNITMRQVRFPSIDHLAYEPIHEVEPLVLTNPLFLPDYDPIGELRMKGPGQVILPVYAAGGRPLAEPAFLQNGRINEMLSTWYEMAPSRDGFDLPIALNLTEPRWISMVALYFNVYDEQNVTPHFDVYAVDLDAEKEILVASARNNRQLFRLLKFPPVRTTQVKLVLVNSINRLRTLTEVELYGPLSGKQTPPGFADPEGQNTYMGDFSRVDKRKKVLWPRYGLLAATQRPPHEQMNWVPPLSQVLLSRENFYVTRAKGYNEVYALANPAQPKSRGKTRALAYGPYVTLYGGLLLKCGYAGKLYCIDAESGRRLWTTQIGERPRGCPVAIGEDVFVASDAFGPDRKGKLAKLDLANGSVMMEVPLSGGVLGSIATDGKRLFFISEDGLAQCFDAASGRQLWKTPVATYTDSTPAVDGGVVYLADRAGTAMALAAATGQVLWKKELGQEFTRCPVVTSDRVIFGCRHGKLAVLNRPDGKSVWTKQTTSRFCYEPVVLGGKVLYFDAREAKLADLATAAVTPLIVPQNRYNQETRKWEKLPLPLVLPDDPMVSISYYKGHLLFVPRHGDRLHTIFYVNHPWYPGGEVFIVSPAAEKQPKAVNAGKGKK